MKQYYDQAFYDSQKTGSLLSAEQYLGYLWGFHAPRSVVDLGCGAGTWLKAAADLGAKTVVGYDGVWNSQQNMVDARIRFNPVDLNQTIRSTEKFDLAMSLEVAEHLEPAVSENFVDSLAALSDVVLFGAAYLGQGGTHHINERLHSDWGAMFRQRGYAIFDLFRPLFWGKAGIDTCYVQNTFLYVNKAHPLYRELLGKGFHELENLAFMNCVHPALYEVAKKRGRTLREKMNRSPGALLASIGKELRRAGRKIGNRLSRRG